MILFYFTVLIVIVQTVVNWLLLKIINVEVEEVEFGVPNLFPTSLEFAQRLHRFCCGGLLLVGDVDYALHCRLFVIQRLPKKVT